MEHSPTNKRRYLSFSLRSLFVVMTVFALYLAWGLNWVQQRKQFLKIYEDSLSARELDSNGGPAQSVPWTLRLMGDSGIHTLYFYQEVSSEVEARAQRLFPEAKMDYLPPPPPPIPTA